MKLNLGCGTNRLEGWSNHDADVNITQPLRWGSGSVDYVLAEHVVEHVHYHQALGFFRECHRVLRAGGVCRIAVPSVERVWHMATPEYGEFVKKWVRTSDGDPARFNHRRRAMANVLFMHGHLAPWTEGLLLSSLYYVGFDDVKTSIPGYSEHPELRDVEGHGRVIGENFNVIETVVVEATK